MHSQALLPTLLLVYDQGGILSDNMRNHESKKLPIKFPKHILSAIGSVYDTGNGEGHNYEFWIKPIGLDRFSAGFNDDSNYNENSHYSYFMIGY